MRVLKTLGRLLLAIVIVVALSVCGMFGVARLAFADASIPRELVLALSATVAMMVVAKLESRTLAQIGFAKKRALAELGVGWLVGVGLMGAVISVMALASAYRVTGVSFPASSLAKAFVLMFLVGWFEETLFRGILFRLVEDAGGSVVALVTSSAFFGAVHLSNPNATPTAAIAIAVEAGLLLGAAFMVTRNLWLAIGIHWGWNFAEGTIFGTALSGSSRASILAAEVSGPGWLTGGAFGPEASVIAVALCLAATWVLFARVRQKKGFVPLRKTAEAPLLDHPLKGRHL